MKVARTTSGKYVVDAVAKALDLLKALSNAEGLTLNEISQRVGLNKSRTFRLLHTLAERGYVERSADGSRYALGITLFELAANVRRDFREVARPFMVELRDRFNEMVNLSVLDESHVLYLQIVESARPFRMSATVGCRMLSHRTSMGKAMLAYLSEHDLRSPYFVHLAKLSRPRLQAIRKELEQVRQDGYAIDREENEPGVACIGAPIFDENGLPRGAMSVSGPVRRILENEKKIADALIAACSGVSKNLGHGGRVLSASTKHLPHTEREFGDTRPKPGYAVLK
jgi:DNA-binding IclR family transcriptional regulator